MSTALPPDQCGVCKVSGVNDTDTTCSPSITLTPEEDTKLLFKCSQPVEQSYTVTITHVVGECAGGVLITYSKHVTGLSVCIFKCADYSQYRHG